MAYLPKRAWVLLFVATGLSLISLALCLSAPPVRADGIAAAHELAHARREFRRHATLEVAETTSGQVAPSESSEPAGFRPTTPAIAFVLRQNVPGVANSSPPRRLLLRPKAASSRSSADDPIS
jgi:hypothetical protein